LGYSIGTGPAARLAADNKPKLLILQAPYYSMTDLVKNIYPFIPGFLLKYKFETNKSLNRCSMPVVVFHGDQDDVIYYGSSLKLKKEFQHLQLITLKDQGHNGMTENKEYLEAVKSILNGNLK
jgi:pimeloyl-ACP methyl ester carboxylesterase